MNLQTWIGLACLCGAPGGGAQLAKLAPSLALGWGVFLLGAVRHSRGRY